MSEVAPDRFRLDAYPYYFSFSRAEGGRATACLVRHEGDEDVRAPRIEVVEPGPEDLAALEGEYRQPELGVSYSVRVEDGTLMLSHRRRGDTRLAPEAADHFTAVGAPFAMLEFVRDDEDGVIGFRTDTLDMLFSKVD